MVAPAECPDCGTRVPGSNSRREKEEARVSTYRLNRLAKAGGVALAGLATGAGSWFLGRPILGVGLFLLALVVAGALMLME